MTSEKKGNFLGIVPFLVFVAIYLGVGIYLDSIGTEMAFYQLKTPIAIFPAIILAFILFKGSIKEKFETFLEGCGHQDIMTMCIIYLLAGGFASVTSAMGGVDSTVNLGLTYIPAKFIAPGVFLIAAFISTATGTSVGAIASLTPIAVELAEKSGGSMPLILAALMGGAMFGDNLSIISDTTIAATRTQGVDMRDKFRVNIGIAIPAAVITLILLVIFGKPVTTPETTVYTYKFIEVLPYLFVLTLAVVGVNVFMVLTGGIILSGAIGLLNEKFTLLNYTNEIYSGFTGMTEIFLLSLLTGGLAMMVSKAGGIDWLISSIQKFIKGKKSAQIGIGLLVGVTDMAVANNTVAIIINGPIAKNIAEKYGVDLKSSAAILDIFSCIAQGAIPYGAQMLIMLSFTHGKVSPLDVMPLLWYQILLGIFTIIFILRSCKAKTLK